MGTRKSVRDLTATERQEFVDALLTLKHERTGSDPISTYDKFVVLHTASMSRYSWFAPDMGSNMLERFLQTLPMGNPSRQFLTMRNAAHRGSAFLPWHREFLRRFEAELKRVTGKADYGLPYWDWEFDGGLPRDQQFTTPVWQMMGGSGDPGNDIVVDGPLGFDMTRVEDPSVFDDPSVWITVDNMGRQNGFLRRVLGVDDAQEGRPDLTLPTQADVDAALSITQYDSDNWDERSNGATSFRNVLEGFAGPSGLHNMIHRWVGGSMSPGTSPNDPVFFLHHCNVDRIWHLWEEKHPTSEYLPQSGGPKGHNWTDPMSPWDGGADIVTVEQASRSDDFSYLEPTAIDPPIA